jgi:hypothetical protein
MTVYSALFSVHYKVSEDGSLQEGTIAVYSAQWTTMVVYSA